MKTDEVPRLIAFLESRVTLAPGEDTPSVLVSPPTVDDLVQAGFDAADAALLIEAPWWPEMLQEVRETPEFCEPEDGPDTVLGYARDVVGEYVRKRFQP